MIWIDLAVIVNFITRECCTEKFKCHNFKWFGNSASALLIMKIATIANPRVRDIDGDCEISVSRSWSISSVKAVYGKD